jgi:hypothetical protein
MLMSLFLFWAVLIIVLALFGFACIKWGVYTSGNTEHATLEI